MTMDLYGHLIDQNLWDAAAKVTPFGPRTVSLSPPAFPNRDLG
jgi:hypothetical protein